MAYQSIWYFTNLPKDIVEILEKDLEKNFDDQLKPSVLGGDHINENIRNSKNTNLSFYHSIFLPDKHNHFFFLFKNFSFFFNYPFLFFFLLYLY